MLCNLLLQANVKHPLNGINFPFRCNITHLSQALALPFSSEILHLQEKYFLQLVCMLNEWKLDDNFMQIFNFFSFSFYNCFGSSFFDLMNVRAGIGGYLREREKIFFAEEKKCKRRSCSEAELLRHRVSVCKWQTRNLIFSSTNFSFVFTFFAAASGKSFFFLSLFSFSFFWFAFEAEQKTHRLRDVCRRKKLQWRSGEKFLPRRVSSFANSPCMRFLQIFTFCW